MMEEAPALTGMCTTEYQGWINGKHPTVDEGTVSREVGVFLIILASIFANEIVCG